MCLRSVDVTDPTHATPVRRSRVTRQLTTRPGNFKRDWARERRIGDRFRRFSRSKKVVLEDLITRGRRVFEQMLDRELLAELCDPVWVAPVEQEDKDHFRVGFITDDGCFVSR